MVNMPAFDTEEQKEHFFPLHFGSYKLCWPAPTDLYANASFLPAHLPEKIPQGNGRAPACGSCAATTPETWLPLQTLLARSLVNFKEASDNLPQCMKKAEKINYKND